jgi:endonuclease YncB( thermonuclease family)
MVAGLVAGSAFGACAEELGASLAACRFAVIGTGTVARVLDGSSFVLTDGREVRLAAIEGVRFPAASPRGGHAPSLTATAALESILAGTTVDLRQQGPAADRYGRTVAFAYLTRGGVERSAAHDLLALGQARVTANVGNPACAAELLSRERAARAAHAGLWSDPQYGIMDAGNLAGLLAEQGHFSVVEGKVSSVRESGGTIYVNFGRRWSEALTVTISKRHERIFAGAGLSPRTFENRRVRVRGWIEERNGPRIEATRPEQVELAELLN